MSAPATPRLGGYCTPSSIRQPELYESDLRISGGAIALGHPFGMTRARITNTLLNNLRTHDKQFGVETMCVGGGQGMAMRRWATQFYEVPAADVKDPV